MEDESSKKSQMEVDCSLQDTEVESVNHAVGDEEDTAGVDQSGVGSMNDHFKPYVDVFVGGLPATITEDELTDAFGVVGDVMSVRIPTNKRTNSAKGYGFVRFADLDTANRACTEVTMVEGCRIGAYISRGMSLADLRNPMEIPLHKPEEDACSISILLDHLRLYPNQNTRAIATAAAFRHAFAERKKASRAHLQQDGFAMLEGANDQPGTPQPGSGLLLRKGNDGSSAEASANAAAAAAAAALPDVSSVMENYPRCKNLIARFQANPNTSNKTALAILHEYATRMCYEMVWDEGDASTLGPFTVKAKLMPKGADLPAAVGNGTARNKKDAKQIVAAEVLESLLQSGITENDFLNNSKPKAKGPGPPQLRSGLGYNSRPGGGPMGRGMLPLRGRGRSPGGLMNGRGGVGGRGGPRLAKPAGQFQGGGGMAQQAQQTQQQQQQVGAYGIGGYDAYANSQGGMGGQQGSGGQMYDSGGHKRNYGATMQEANSQGGASGGEYMNVLGRQPGYPEYRGNEYTAMYSGNAGGGEMVGGVMGGPILQGNMGAGFMQQPKMDSLGQMGGPMAGGQDMQMGWGAMDAGMQGGGASGFGESLQQVGGEVGDFAAPFDMSFSGNRGRGRGPYGRKY